ncbi:dual specificity protein phosphatase 12 isoform X2 [Xyrichtys novacula]|uniref:protein-tyrosine-phosphatase n=1 Tax=Xyrichtys novacula TaxID=13765 RepID=A0AAV1GD23_XYRNO|nr:dual specificity protein phosphatase 12 isoform X2 [Xyrichtys novacula]
MILVDPGLYIGTAADLNDSQALINAAITHILSVDSVDPRCLLSAQKDLCMKWVTVLDETTSDLLSHMDDCYLFIQEAVDGGGAVLVHWVNSGFEQQLCLYEDMICQVDTSSPLYKQYRLTKISEKYPELRQVPTELFAVDPSNSSSREASYRCRKCRRALFRSSSILSHPVGDGARAFSHKKSSNLTGDIQCTSYFIEPVQWMQDALLGVMNGQVWSTHDQ